MSRGSEVIGPIRTGRTVAPGVVASSPATGGDCSASPAIANNALALAVLFLGTVSPTVFSPKCSEDHVTDAGALPSGSDRPMNNHVMSPDTWTAAFAGGLLMGVIHVVTGADHLSAVATLSCGNDRYAATVLGVRWGVGHCVGLLVVFLAVLAASEEIDRASVRGVEKHMGIVVGLLMLGLGAYGLWDARRSGWWGARRRRRMMDTRRRGGTAPSTTRNGATASRGRYSGTRTTKTKRRRGASKGGGGGGGGTSRRHVAVRGGGGHRRRPRRRGTRRRARRFPRGGPASFVARVRILRRLLRRDGGDDGRLRGVVRRGHQPARRRARRAGAVHLVERQRRGVSRGWRGVDRVIGVGARRGARGGVNTRRGGGGGTRGGVGAGDARVV